MASFGMAVCPQFFFTHGVLGGFNFLTPLYPIGYVVCHAHCLFGVESFDVRNRNIRLLPLLRALQTPLLRAMFRGHIRLFSRFIHLHGLFRKLARPV